MAAANSQKHNTPEVRAFMAAVRRGDQAGVRTLLEGDASLVRSHDYDSFGATALIHAANQGDRGMIDLLLEFGADINARSDWWAGSFGVLPKDDPEMVQFLVDRGAEVQADTMAALGWVDRLRELLDGDPAAVHQRFGDGQLALHYASNPEIVDLLLERGVDIDARCIDHEGTAAQYAAHKRHAVARRLIARGAAADPFLAAAIGDVDLLRKYLDEDGVALDVRATDAMFPTSDNTEACHIYAYTIGMNTTLLHVAASAGSAEAVRFLIERGADVDARGSYDDGTPLHFAAWNNQVAAADALLDGGADINRKSGRMHNNEPIGWAAVAGNVETVARLIERGARVEAYHAQNAREGERGTCNFTGAPREVFRRIAEMLEAKLGAGD